MIQSKNKILDDIARVAGGAVSIASGLSKQVKEEIRARVDEMALKLDLVPREDFERLEARVEALENAALRPATPIAAKAPAKKAALKKSTAQKPKAKKATIAKKPLQKKTAK